jgi:bud site selection protein 20
MSRQRSNKRARKRRERGPELDVIHKELRERGPFAAETEADWDLPGLGQFRCVVCSRYFISRNALDEHSVSKPHKRRVKLLGLEAPYTVGEARWAAGLGPAPF